MFSSQLKIKIAEAKKSEFLESGSRLPPAHDCFLFRPKSRSEPDILDDSGISIRCKCFESKGGS